jgi:hypothetical protein
MTHKDIDKIMKPYWGWKFKDSYLSDFCEKREGWSDDWYGIIMKRPDGSEKLIVGHMLGDDNNMWFYDGSMFSGGEHLFNLGIGEFNRTMVRYINKKYNLKVKSVL